MTQSWKTVSASCLLFQKAFETVSPDNTFEEQLWENEAFGIFSDFTSSLQMTRNFFLGDTEHTNSCIFLPQCKGSVSRD